MMLSDLADNLAWPVIATLAAAAVTDGARRIRQRGKRRAAAPTPVSDPRSAAVAEFDAGVALAAASLHQVAELRRLRLNAVRDVEKRTDEARERYSQLGRPYSALRTSVDAPLMNHVDYVMSALGSLADVLQRARRFPVASTREWTSAWDDFLTAQTDFRDVARQQLGASPYRRVT